MEREKKKRGREEEKKDAEKNAKKQDHIGFDDCNFFNISDSFRSFEVFDFPWLKENLVSEDNCKFDDVFSSSLLDTSSVIAIDFPIEELCTTPALNEFPSEKLEDESWLSDVDQIDGTVDCIWNSVLNQPISMGTSKVCNR